MRFATRPAYERIIVIDREIREGRFPNARTLAALCEVDPRTIQRDLEFFRERIRAPLVFDSKRNGYRYSDSTFNLPSVSLTEGELLAIFVAEQALRQFRGTPFSQDLRRAFNKIRSGLSERITVDLNQLSESYSFRQSSPASCDPIVFATLAKAIDQQTTLLLTYRSLTATFASSRSVDPYHLACIDGIWYLIAHCHQRRDVRLFVPSRIEKAQETGANFDIPESFDINEYLGRSLSVFRGSPGELHRVRIRFQGIAARTVSEHDWQADPVIEHLGPDDLILELKLSHLREGELLALSWGDLAEVLEPEELRLRIRQTLERSLRRYRQ